MHGKCSCAKFVGCFHSTDTSKMRTYTGLLTKHPWMVLQSILLVPTTAAAAPYTRLLYFDTAVYNNCIQHTLLSMKRWCQLNRARVAHDARPALSSYQNKSFKPGRSHHNSDICNLWSLTVLLVCLHYDSTDWNLCSGQRRRPISDRVGQYHLLQGLYGGLCVLQCRSIFLSTFYVSCSSLVCSDCANVAMNGKVKAI